MASRDRRAQVLASDSVNGIDFVTIANAGQTELVVHFLNGVAITLSSTPTITGGETIPSVPVLPVGAADWGMDGSHLTLILRVAAPGDFSTYTLTLPSPQLDRFFDHVGFSFKAGCPSDLDCAPAAVLCPPVTGDAPPIDYTAKDFLSFRQALLDFSTLRYPNWQERSEADFGVMFLEALCAVADDLSYTQDRIATEASLMTATQRRSVLRHARLVDYEAAPALCASTWLQFEVAGTTTSIPHGLATIAPAADGTPVVFETGPGLALRASTPVPPASALWNRATAIAAYWFDDSQVCLAAGATHMHVAGHGYGFIAGQLLLIETPSDVAGDPPVRQIVTLTASAEICDALFPIPVTPGPAPVMTCPTSPPGGAIAPAAVTRIAWGPTDALTAARDLTNTIVVGNVVPATQGRTVTETFIIGPPPPGIANPIPSAVERAGPAPLLAPGVCGPAPAIRLYTLGQAPLGWLPNPATDTAIPALPEILLAQTVPSGLDGPIPWGWVSSLLAAQPFDASYTLDAAAYSVIATNSDASVQSDYDGDAGATIRFGDSVFGANPDVGMQFSVTYRYGAGAAGNVAADAVARLDPATEALGLVTAVANPLAASGGADAQALQSIQRLAPQQFRAIPLRAVLASDYAAAAETQAWVKRAGTVFRWTGSWLTTFTTPEPLASEQIPIDDRLSLIQLLNRFRMAGTESYVPDPEYASIDLIIELCAQAQAFAAGVRQAVVAALSPTGPGAAAAFFAVSRFVFGQPLQRSALEAAIQAVPGVAGVTCIHYRLRDLTTNFLEMGDQVVVGANQIIRCDNDPSRPNAGALAIIVRGGR